MHSADYIWNAFKKTIPGLDEQVVSFRKLGTRDAIIIYFKKGYPLIFTYINDKCWMLEPYQS